MQKKQMGNSFMIKKLINMFLKKKTERIEKNTLPLQGRLWILLTGDNIINDDLEFELKNLAIAVSEDLIICNWLPLIIIACSLGYFLGSL